jgi:hypothetical protein
VRPVQRGGSLRLLRSGNRIRRPPSTFCLGAENRILRTKLPSRLKPCRRRAAAECAFVNVHAKAELFDRLCEWQVLGQPSRQSRGLNLRVFHGDRPALSQQLSSWRSSSVHRASVSIMLLKGLAGKSLDGRIRSHRLPALRTSARLKRTVHVLFRSDMPCATDNVETGGYPPANELCRIASGYTSFDPRGRKSRRMTIMEI